MDLPQEEQPRVCRRDGTRDCVFQQRSRSQGGACGNNPQPSNCTFQGKERGRPCRYDARSRALDGTRQERHRRRPQRHVGRSRRHFRSAGQSVCRHDCGSGRRRRCSASSKRNRWRHTSAGTRFRAVNGSSSCAAHSFRKRRNRTESKCRTCK